MPPRNAENTLAAPLAIHAGRIVAADGAIHQDRFLIVRNGRIAEIGETEPPPDAAVFDASTLTLLPGFIDVHLHGGGGADTMDATPDALRTICRIHAQYGTTGLLLTTITQSASAIHAALCAAATARQSGSDFCPDGAQILGIHLEGPYIHPKRPGAQPKEWVRDYDAGEFADWQTAAAGGALKLITLAPERPNADQLIAACRTAGIVVSMGHTDADANETRQALKMGVTHATHLFNAMPGIHHRAPGPVPVLLTDSRARVEIIADGHHVAPDVVRMIVAAKKTDGVVAVTDAMRGAGAGDGVYDLGGHAVTVQNGRATLADGTLAGSVLTMNRAAANLQNWCALSWHDVARVTATNAAEQLGLTSKGRIQSGGDADLILVDDNFDVHATFVAGRCVYEQRNR